jgi:putative aldouronate transport system substrate-binding protein
MYAKDRKVRYGYATPEYRYAVKEIARWYEEGLIDKEIFTRGNQTREQLLSINVGGSTHDWFSSTSVFNESYKERIKGFSFVPIAPPADINGVVKEMESRSALHGLGWGISKDNNKVNDTIKYFDFWMSPEGRKLASYGVEGVHYTEENGKIKFSDEVINYEKGAPTYLRNQGQVEFGTIGSLEAELIAMNEIGRNGFEMYRKNNWCQIPFETDLIKEEQDVVSAYLNDINTYAKEQEQKWITGEDSVDDKWDNYLKTLDSMHLSEVITAYQSGWERINVK